MINEFDIVRIKIDLTNEIKKNTTGTVLSVYDNGNFFLVEFFDKNEETIGDGMTLVKLEDIKIIYKNSISSNPSDVDSYE